MYISFCLFAFMLTVQSFDYDVEENYMRQWIASNIPSNTDVASSTHTTISLSAYPNIFILIPGVGYQEDRIKILMNNLKILNLSRMHVQFSCLMFAYRHPTSHQRREIEKYCDIEIYFHGNFASYMKAALPKLLVKSGYSHVMVLLDDLQLPFTFRLDNMMAIMNRNNLSVISPTIIGATYPSTTCSFCKPRLRSDNAQTIPATYLRVGHQVDVIEIFAAMFTMPAWDCWWRLLQPSLNSIGWGYDRCLKKFCSTSSSSSSSSNFTMGIVTSVIAVHATDRIMHRNPVDNALSDPFAQLHAWQNVTNSYSLYGDEVIIRDALL